MLNSLSASSSTNVLISERCTAFESTRSNNLPGVATNTFTLLSAFICGFIETPPKTAKHFIRSGKAALNC